MYKNKKNTIVSIFITLFLLFTSFNVTATSVIDEIKINNSEGRLIDRILSKDREWKWEINGYWETDVEGDWDIVVPCDYPTIQEAVRDADAGDRIFVREGVYNENVEINKDGILLQGEGIDKTIADGNKIGNTLTINASYVKISGFTFRSSGYLKAGICICTGSGNIIHNNKIANNKGDGIRLRRANGNIITGNIIENNKNGLVFSSSSLGNTVENNTISINRNSGIMLKELSNINIFFGNKITKNKFGVKCVKSYDNLFHHNNFLQNAFNAYDSANNLWDNESEGNYWSDYLGVDLDDDGVGDVYQYIPGGDNYDRYPLMNPIDQPVQNTKSTEVDGYEDPGFFDLTETGNTLTVDDEGDGDYIKIQYAIDNADIGDTIEVYSGTYNENIQIPLGVVLKGIPEELEGGGDSGMPCVSGDGQDHVFLVKADGTQISGFEIKNAKSGYAGIKIQSNSSMVANNSISDCSYGTNLLGHSNNIIINNVIKTNNIGIYSHLSYDNKVTRNFIEQNNDGIILSKSSAEISGNCIENNSFNGLLQHMSKDVTIIDNTLLNHNEFGIQLFNSKDNVINGNILSSNFRAGISLFNCSDTIIYDNSIKTNVDSISVLYSKNVEVSSNECNENCYGIHISYSEKNDILGNEIINSTKAGIYLGMSKSNSLQSNNMIKCGLLVDSYKLSCWWNNVDQSNTANGKKIYYYINETGLISFPNAGQIILVNCTSCSVNNLDFDYVSVGIELSYSENNEIIANNMNHVRKGIVMVHCSHNNISENYVNNSGKKAIFISWNSNCNNITRNTISNIGEVGLALEACDNNTISENSVGEIEEIIINKNLESFSCETSITADPADSRDYIVEIFFFKIGMALGFGSNNNLVSDNKVGGVNIGIAIGHILRTLKGNIVINNVIMNNDEGIVMGYSSNNYIIGNVIYNSTFAGIAMDWLSDNNYIIENHLEKGYGGVGLRTCNDNIILGNTIRGFQYLGVFLWYSANNTIQKNNFINNRRHASFNNGYESTWYNNYWDDYKQLRLLRRPKIIRGGINIINNRIPYVSFRVPILWFNLDRCPALEPYEI